MGCVDELWKRRRLRTRPTLEDLLNPIEENEVGDSPYRFPGGDEEIIAEAQRLTTADGTDNPDRNAQEMIDDDDEDEADCSIPVRKGIELCEQVERLCVMHSDIQGINVLGLQGQLRKLRSHLWKLDNASQKQVVLDQLWTSGTPNE